MRMPLVEFLISGDPKFIVVFIIFIAIAIFHFIKKLKNKPDVALVGYHNAKIDNASFWILISSVLSLLLGFMHSFYFIGKAGGIAPHLIFNGVSYALITPVLGIIVFIISKILRGIYNTTTK